jgi:hypothetical protein
MESDANFLVQMRFDSRDIDDMRYLSVKRVNKNPGLIPSCVPFANLQKPKTDEHVNCKNRE